MESPIEVAGSLVAITPNDSANITEQKTPCALFVGNGGNVRVLGVNDSTPVTLENVASGTFLPVKVVRVYATGTSATGILGIR